MSSNHSPEFKAKVALEAVSEQNKVFSEIAEKYGVSEEEVAVWSSQLAPNTVSIFSGAETHASSHSHTTSIIEDVSLESDDEEFTYAVQHGVESDNLNYNRLFFWSGLGVAVVTVFIVALIFFAKFSYSNALQNVSETSSYVEITKLKADQNEELNSFGVVDLEKGIYRIPIEDAIDKIAID